MMASPTIRVRLVGAELPLDPASGFVLESNRDYVRACELIRQQTAKDQDLVISIRQEKHGWWLRRFLEQTGIPHSFSEYGPLEILAERWNVHVPDWLTPENIVENHLLDLHIRQQTKVEFEDALLSHLLGKIFNTVAIAEEHIPTLVQVLTRPETSHAFSQHPIVRKCLEVKCGWWAEQTEISWIKDICIRLSQDLDTIWQELTAWALLGTYPSKLLEFVVPLHRANQLRSIPAGILNGMPFHGKTKQQAETQIELFLAEIGKSIKNSDDFERILDATSGLLSTEFRHMKEILAADVFPVKREDVEAVRRKFQSCPEVGTSSLLQLDSLIAPPRPQLPQSSDQWGVEEWIRWAIRDYMPYRHWQTKAKVFDAEVEQQAGHFTDWYLRQYSTLHQQASVSLTHVLSSLRDRLSADALALIVLLDGLPAIYWRHLSEALRVAGLHQVDSGWRLAPLPSHTALCKPLLLSGGWDDSNQDYRAIVELRAQQEWGKRAIVYVSSLKELSDCQLSQEPSVVIFNFLSTDELLHADVESENATHEEKLHLLFVKLQETVVDLYKRWGGPIDQFSLYALTDHGACRVLGEEKQTLDSKVVQKIFTEANHRFAEVGADEAQNVPQNLWGLGYRFQPPIAKVQDRCFFIPKGHNTVKLPKQAKGYLHGGATPEEIIVPWVVWRTVRPAIKDLAARFLDLPVPIVFYVQRLTTLAVEISNPNSQRVRVLEIRVVQPETDLVKFEPLDLEGKQSGQIAASMYFKKSALGRGILQLALDYEIEGERHTLELPLQVEFRSAQMGGFSLKDLK